MTLEIPPAAWIAFGAALFIGFGAAGVWLPFRLVRHRTDIPRERSPFSGSSVFVQFNYMNPENYSDEGRSKLGWIYGATFLQILGGFMVLIGIAKTW